MAVKDYFAAAYPEPWQVLGIRLRPFSLGHFIKLSRFKNAFVAEQSATATLGDLVMGVAVCSMSNNADPSKDEFWQWWNQPAKFNLWAWLFRKTPMTPAERDMVIWGKSVGTLDGWQEKAKLFADYITAHSEPPGFWITDEKPARKSGAHWVHAVTSRLVSECGYTQDEVLNVPVCKALQDYLKSAEDQGAVRLVSLDLMEATNGA